MDPEKVGDVVLFLNSETVPDSPLRFRPPSESTPEFVARLNTESLLIQWISRFAGSGALEISDRKENQTDAKVLSGSRPH
jgi:hypothetical protein